MSKFHFKTEVSQLLELIIHSLYSHKEIFLRELVSNSSDALDKLKYFTLTEDKFKDLKFNPQISLKFEEGENSTLTISDNGIGMDKDDLINNLGTIASSGTKKFLKNLSGDAKKDSNLIGQFGVGFYACYMVAGKVEVTSKKAGSDKAWRWISDGKGDFEILESEREEQGTDIKLFLNDEGKEYASRWQIESLIGKYSDHIPFPIFLSYDDISFEGDDRKEIKTPKTEQVNKASALWRTNKSELKDKDYNEFYKTISHDMEDPLFTIHTKAEGTIEYTTLFYIPKKAPADMYYADYKAGVKLYVKRVFITDDSKELLPPYLRFLRGVIDSEDLPLNVSREILQQNRVMNQIRTASVKKVLSELKSMAKNNEEKYTAFIEQFNRPLKEGLYSDFANRDSLLNLVRFKSTESDSFTSLAAYKERMKEDQKVIYYITGAKEDALRKSPLLNGYKKQGLEVLICDDEIDEIIVPSIGQFEELQLKAVNRSDAQDELKSEDDKKKENDFEPVLKKIKKELKGLVKDVKASTALGDAPAAVVADENDPTAQMQQMFKAMGQGDLPEVLPILQVNPNHPMLKAVEDNSKLVSDLSYVLLDQSLLLEGAEIKKPAEFIERINRLMVEGISMK